MGEKITIEDLGYDNFFESNRKKLKLDDFQVGRVVAEYKGAYRVKNENGEYLAKITGKRMFEASSREDYPAVGDWVAIAETAKGQVVIRGILPRKTLIKRVHGDKDRGGRKNEVQVIAANIDTAFIVESLDRDFNLNRFERYFVIAKEAGVKPVIVLNKTDLVSEEELDSKLAEIKNRFKEIEVIKTSAIKGDGFQELKKYIEKGKTCCFLGSSGAGKSSLINKLLGENIIKTKEIGSRSFRGQHTTTGREMYFLENSSTSLATSGGIVVDNPGIREVGIADAGEGLDNFFDEITALGEKCKFADCAHMSEPGCEVLSALNSGKLDAEKYSNYVNLRKESEYYEMTEQEKREKDRRFGKFIKTYKKQSRK